MARSGGGIGTQKESSLHETLKKFYTGTGGKTEVSRRGFICDGVSAGGAIIEVQCGNFGGFYKKAAVLSRDTRLIIIYPVIKTCFIELYDTGGKLLRRRKSPRRGSYWDIFGELIHAPLLPLLAGVSIELALVDAAERRVQDGKGSWRRKGVSIHDRELLAFYKSVTLKGPAAYRRFIPPEMKGDFTVKTLAEKAGIGEEGARKAVYVLHKLGLIKRNGKDGRSWLYRQVKKRTAS